MHNPGASILGDSWGNTSVFSRQSRAGPPQPFPDAISGKKKGAAMKFATVSKSLVMGLALLLASSAFAATKASLTLQNPTTINGTKLKAGDYKLQWEGSGPNVEVSIIQGKNVVAKVPAKLVDLQAVSHNDAAVTRKNDDGTTSLTGARFDGKKYALELGGESSDGMQAGSSK
jgi:hypothetical protein